LLAHGRWAGVGPVCRVGPVLRPAPTLPQSQKSRLRITPGLCFLSLDYFCYFTRVSTRDAEIKMVTAAELRAWAEESLEWAQIATNESSRQTFIRWAEIWLELASRGERLTALIEDRSKEPTPTARKRQRSSESPRFDQLAFDFAKI
jgi:hypothetical protein